MLQEEKKTKIACFLHLLCCIKCLQKVSSSVRGVLAGSAGKVVMTQNPGVLGSSCTGFSSVSCECLWARHIRATAKY